jgi:hypothetical protein
MARARSDKAQKGVAADKSRRYMPRYQVATVVLPPAGLSLDESGVQLARALVFSETLPLERTASRYVICASTGGSIVAELPLNLTTALDNEYALRAAWAAVRVYPREKGQVRVLIKRVAPRHGFVSTYQNDGCRCPDCTAANAEAMLEYRHRVAPSMAKAPRKHGAQCWKYGCHCEERRAADRLRQSRHRSRVAAAQSADAASQDAEETPASSATHSNMRVIPADEMPAEERKSASPPTPSAASRREVAS